MSEENIRAGDPDQLDPAVEELRRAKLPAEAAADPEDPEAAADPEAVEDPERWDGLG